MSLPSYIINFDELKTILEDALSNVVVKDLADVYGIQRVQGFALAVPAMQGAYKVIDYNVPENMIITGITFSQSAWKADDYWEFWIDNDRLFESVYTKEMGDKKHWEVLNPVNENQQLKLVVHNNSGNSRYVWADIEYIKLSDILKHKK